MSALELDHDDRWKDVFLDDRRRETPPRDYQPDWRLTAVGVSLCVLALLALTT